MHTLSNSDLYPNVWVCVQILAELSVSAILRRLAANGNLTHLKSVSLFSTIHISRSWLICWLASKGFADALCEWDCVYLPSVQQHGGFPMTDLELWVDLWIARKGCLHSKPLQGVCKSVFLYPVYFKDLQISLCIIQHIWAKNLYKYSLKKYLLHKCFPKSSSNKW